MEFRVLGPLEVLDGDRSLELGAPRERALLAFLLLHANQVVAADRIVEALWPGNRPATAAKIVQVYVSRLRKAFGPARDVLESRGPGYLVRVGPAELDLYRFEQLVERGAREEAAAKAKTLREALALWRGTALAEFAYETFVQAEAARLEELRLLALEERVDADLTLGRGPELVPELESLVAEHPVRERMRAQLMRALYRAGRQADALAAFREGRQLLDEELGLEPSAELRALESAILRHDPALVAAARSEPARSIVVVPERPAALAALLSLAEALALGPAPKQIVLAEIVASTEVAEATAALDATRRELAERGVQTRIAAFSSSSPATDAVRLAHHHHADLLLVSAADDPLAGPFAGAFADAACDVAALVERGGPLGDGPAVVPFGAFEHDWAALELGAWLARALARPLRLIGAADGTPERGDASRLLADASLIVQHTSGIVAEPLLGPSGREGLAALAADAGILVVGLSERWRTEGLGGIRSALAAEPPSPMVLVRRGVRPSGLAPPATLTRFTWSLERPTIGR
jgi:DNA-binding SARP family transcriptional activator